MHNLFYFLWCLLHDLSIIGKVANTRDFLDIVVTENSEIFLDSSKIFIAKFLFLGINSRDIVWDTLNCKPFQKISVFSVTKIRCVWPPCLGYQFNSLLIFF